jgi:ribosome-associated translation inhibitor RaiA
MQTMDVIGGPWKGPDGPRVLIENSDLGVGYSLERLLIEQGYAAAVCEGPDCRQGRRCALVETGECDLVSNADVIVHSLDLDRRDNAEVLQALRSCYPAARTVVEISEPSVARHRELLEGCSLLPFPATRTSLTSAVEASLARLALGCLDQWPGRLQPPGNSVVATDVIPTITAYLVGPLTSTERAYAEQKVAYVLRFAPVLAPVADLELRFETGPGWERPALAKVTVDVNGRRVRVYADAATMFVAVDALAARLHRRLEELCSGGGASP